MLAPIRDSRAFREFTECNVAQASGLFEGLVQPFPTHGFQYISDDHLEIEIRNPVPQDQSGSKGGNQMALANIRQRFELAYGAKASVDVEESDDAFSIKLRFPCEEHEA